MVLGIESRMLEVRVSYFAEGEASDGRLLKEKSDKELWKVTEFSAEIRR